jgi:hypothetical protein
MNETIMPEELARGAARLWRIPEKPGAVKIPLTAWVKNLVLFGWAGPAARLLAEGLSNYRISGMYLEYENVADPDDPVTVPTFDRTGGLEYYTSLAASPDRDYLRVALTAATVESTDEAKFPDGNLMTFFAQSQGVVGANGKTFSDSVNSKVFGGALVAIRAQADAAQDIIFSRFYFPTADQQVKLPTSQIGLEWQIELQ